MNVTSYYQNLILDYAIGTTPGSKPATVYVALHTGDPMVGGGSEVSSNGYARASLANNNSAVVKVSDGVKATAVAVTFPTATGSWGTVTHWSIKDTLTSGNTLFYGALTASKAIASGDSFTIPIGGLTFAFA
jgi:hypothetical protein